MTHEDIIDRAAESIMQRANDTYPRTLHKDMLRDEIGKAIREATKKQQSWPPPLMLHDPELVKQYEAMILPYLAKETDAITASHNEARKKLSDRLNESYYGEPE